MWSCEKNCNLLSIFSHCPSIIVSNSHVAQNSWLICITQVNFNKISLRFWKTFTGDGERPISTGHFKNILYFFHMSTVLVSLNIFRLQQIWQIKVFLFLHSQFDVFIERLWHVWNFLHDWRNRIGVRHFLHKNNTWQVLVHFSLVDEVQVELQEDFQWEKVRFNSSCLNLLRQIHNKIVYGIIIKDWSKVLLSCKKEVP